MPLMCVYETCLAEAVEGSRLCQPHTDQWSTIYNETYSRDETNIMTLWRAFKLGRIVLCIYPAKPTAEDIYEMLRGQDGL